MKSSASSACTAAASRASIAACNPAMVSRKACSGGVRAQPAECQHQRRDQQAFDSPCSHGFRPYRAQRRDCSSLACDTRLAALPAYGPMLQSLATTVRRRIRAACTTAIYREIAMSIERPWLAVIRQASRRRSTSTSTPRSSPCSQGPLEKYRDRPAFANLGKVLTYAEVDRLSRAVRRLPARRAEAEEGRSRRDHDAQLPAVPDRDFGVLRAGLTVVNTNPMYTARELKHQLVDSGASAIVVLDNFGTPCRKCSPTPRSSRSSPPASATCSAFPKGAIVNFVLKHVKKMVPDYDIPGAIRFKRRARRWARCSTLPEVDDRPRATSPSCSTPAAPPAWPRARC